MDNTKNEYNMIVNEINNIKNTLSTLKNNTIKKLENVSSEKEKKKLMEEYEEQMYELKYGQNLEERYKLLKKRLEYLESEMNGTSTSRDKTLHELLDKYKNISSSCKQSSSNLSNIIKKIKDKSNNNYDDDSIHNSIFINYNNNDIDSDELDTCQIPLSKDEQKDIIDYYKLLINLKNELKR